MGVPQNGWFISGNPIRMDDLGIPSMETPISTNGDKWWIVFEIEDVWLQELGFNASWLSSCFLDGYIPQF